MVKSLADVRRVTATEPPRIVIYGPPGVGKTSLASEWPAPVFLQIEDGNVAGLELDSFGEIEGWLDVLDAMRSLANNQHDYQTLVVDSMDKLEPLIWQHVCLEHKCDSIEEVMGGFGKGYIETDRIWWKFFGALDYLRSEIKMNIVLIGHSCIINWPNPTGAEFPRWDFRLHKRAHGIVEDSVDAVLMVNYDHSSTTDKTKKVKSSGSTLRWIHCQGSPALNAKNRLNMPEKLLYQHGAGYQKLSPYFPNGKGSNGVQSPIETDNDAAEE